MKVACRPAREPRLPATTPVRRGMGKGVGGRETRPGGSAPPPRLAPGGGGVASGVCPSPRPALPATSLEVGPRVRRGCRGGCGGCPVRLPRPPTPPPVAPATTASPPPRPADPARRGSSGRVSRAVRRDGRRLPRRGAARPAPSPPAPPALGRSASAGRRRSSRRPGPVARSPGASPRPSGPRGSVPPPPPPPTPPGGLCVSVRVLPPSRLPPLPAGRQASRRSPCPLPAAPSVVVAAGGRVPGNAGAGRGAPPHPRWLGERGWGRSGGAGPVRGGV